jgi:hypothetical protein
MGMVAKDVLEVALLIAATAEPFRSQLIALARSLPKSHPVGDTGRYRILPDIEPPEKHKG